MTDTEFVYVLWEEFKKKLEKNNLSEDAQENVLISKSFSLSFYELLNFYPQKFLSINSQIFYHSLVLYSSVKVPKDSLHNLSSVLISFKFLIKVAPSHATAITNFFLCALIDFSLVAFTFEEVFSFSDTIFYLKNIEADCSDLTCTLSNKFNWLFWDLLSTILNDFSHKENEIEKLFEYLIKANEIEIDIKESKERAFDILTQYIEYKTEFFEVFLQNQEINGQNADFLLFLIGLSHKLMPCSEFYAKKLKKYENLLEKHKHVPSEIENLLKKSEICVEYVKNSIPIYERRSDSCCIKIFRGHLKKDNTKIVVKSYKKLTNAFDLKNFETEVKIFKILSEKSSPSNAFLKFYGTLCENQKFIILLENCETDLFSKMVEMRKNNEKFSEDHLKNMISVLLRSYTELAEQQIFHRDIKPRNILINKDLSVKITDFNVADLKKGERNSWENAQVRGSADYMAPELRELLKSGQKSGYFNPEKADVFSLGMTFLELKTFETISSYNFIENHQKLVDLLNQISPLWLATLLKNMLGLDPDQRLNFRDLLYYLPEENTISL